MKEELNKIFNAEVEQYRNSLLYYAKACEWDTFKEKAGRLFDYVESIEMSEIERKFFNISKVIVAVLAIVVVVILKLNMSTLPEIAGIKKLIIIMALAGGSFEVYFFLNFKTYMKNKTNFYKKRKERFIIDIDGDFKNISVQSYKEPSYDIYKPAYFDETLSENLP
jgi:hypothetical protein